MIGRQDLRTQGSDKICGFKIVKSLAEILQILTIDQMSSRSFRPPDRQSFEPGFDRSRKHF